MNFHDWLSLAAVLTGPVTGVAAAKIAQRVEVAVIKTQIKGLAGQVMENKGRIDKCNDRIDGVIERAKG